MYNKLKLKIIEQKKNILYYNYHKLKIEIMNTFNRNLISEHEVDNLIKML